MTACALVAGCTVAVPGVFVETAPSHQTRPAAVGIGDNTQLIIAREVFVRNGPPPASTWIREPIADYFDAGNTLFVANALWLIDPDALQDLFVLVGTSDDVIEQQPVVRHRRTRAAHELVRLQIGLPPGSRMSNYGPVTVVGANYRLVEPS